MINWDDMAKARGYVNAEGDGDEKAMLMDLYHEKKMSLDGLTKELNVSRNALRQTLLRLEIPTKSRGGANNQKFVVTDALIEAVKERGVKVVALELGVSYTTLYKRLYCIVPKNETPSDEPSEEISELQEEHDT